jgi:hypothetical protein
MRMVVERLLLGPFASCRATVALFEMAAARVASFYHIHPARPGSATSSAIATISELLRSNACTGRVYVSAEVRRPRNFTGLSELISQLPSTFQTFHVDLTCRG